MNTPKKLSLEEKWEIARIYYESVYRHPKTGAPIRFTRTPEPKEILELYDSIKKLAITEQKILERKRLQEMR